MTISTHEAGSDPMAGFGGSAEAAESTREPRTWAASESTTPAADAARPIELLPTLAITLFVVSVVRMAWLTDDGFVTFRAVDNWVHGHGLVSNPPERVLGFTNPLWAMLLAVPMGLRVPMYTAVILTSVLCALATAYVLARRASPTPLVAGIVLTWCTLSSAFVDYSTSGLENPLAHLLLALFFTLWLKGGAGARERPWAWLLAALVGLNRLDHLALVAPALLTFFFDARSDRPSPLALPRVAKLGPLVRPALLGFLPLALWFVFAIVYYGFPYPNTAYAKLNTTIPKLNLMGQGAWYLVDALKRDPLTSLVIALAFFTALRGSARERVGIAGGIGLYVLYILRVGGDFMAGRFHTAPFAVAVVWLAVRFLPRCKVPDLVAVWGVTAVVGLLFSTTFQTQEKPECFIVPSGVVNERRCYVEFTGLAENVRILKYKKHGGFVVGQDAKNAGKKVIEALPGLPGVGAGPDVHIVDPFALTDPLLARIPYVAGVDFRTGHFPRAIPAGYLQTIETGKNVIVDPCIATYYDALSKVIRGPLFSAERFRAMAQLNSGKLDYLLREPCQLPPRKL